MHDFARWLGTWIFVPFFQVRVHGRERVPRTGPVVVVANHQSFVDGPLLFAVLGVRRPVFLVKEEMFTGPLGPPLRRIGQLSVRRGVPDRAPLLGAVRVLRDGGLVAVFPEGTRGLGDLTNMKHGAAWLAAASGASVLPVVFRGTRRPAGSHRRFRPRLDVLVGEPFALECGVRRSELAEATDTIRDELTALVERARLLPVGR